MLGDRAWHVIFAVWTVVLVTALTTKFVVHTNRSKGATSTTRIFAKQQQQQQDGTTTTLIHSYKDDTSDLEDQQDNVPKKEQPQHIMDNDNQRDENMDPMTLLRLARLGCAHIDMSDASNFQFCVNDVVLTHELGLIELWDGTTECNDLCVARIACANVVVLVKGDDDNEEEEENPQRTTFETCVDVVLQTTTSEAAAAAAAAADPHDNHTNNDFAAAAAQAWWDDKQQQQQQQQATNDTRRWLRRVVSPW